MGKRYMIVRCELATALSLLQFHEKSYLYQNKHQGDPPPTHTHTRTVCAVHDPDKERALHPSPTFTHKLTHH